jgi:predicted hydrolase (HD superfamily)
MDEDRVKHSLAVAKKMTEIGREKNFSKEQIKELFLLGIVHDIGYEFDDSEYHDSHNSVGGDILKNDNYKYWREVYYHGKPNCEYKSEYLDILNEADMSVDKYGNDVGFVKRLEDIRSRYGEESNAYINSKMIIEEIKNK